ncbi:MAG: ABC transporter permease [Chloroflexota bacterium]
MSKTWLIIKHEYLTNIKRRSFLFGAFGAPIISLVLMTVVFGLIINNEADVERLGSIGTVDEAGVLTQQIDAPENFHAYETEAAARADLDSDAIGAYFVLPPDYLDNGKVRVVSKTGVPDALDDQIDSYLRANLSAGLSPELAERIKDPLDSSILALDTGRVLKEESLVGLFLVPVIFVIVFLFASQTTSGYLMGSVVEEKTNRIVEILVTSVTPFQLLSGKIIGLGLLGLTQLVVWMIFGTIALKAGNNVSFLSGITIPTDLLIVCLIYFLLGYFLLSSVMAGLGVIAGSEQESRQYAGIFSIIMVIPIFLIVSFITDPNSAVVTFLTLFPLTSPVAVILRMGFGVVPTEQLIASMIILALTALFAAWASARIFRWGLLMYGKRPSPRELIRVIRRPATMATSASGEQAS